MWLDTSACQEITEGAATEMICGLMMAENHQLREPDGGSRLRELHQPGADLEFELVDLDGAQSLSGAGLVHQTTRPTLRYPELFNEQLHCPTTRVRG